MKLAQRLMMGRGVGWTPVAITTALWLDAADSATITLSGSKVSQWQDKSGNERHAVQTSDSIRPVLETNRVAFSGGSRLNLPSSWLSGARFMVFGVASRGSTSSNGQFTGTSSTTANKSLILGHDGSNFKMAQYSNDLPSVYAPVSANTPYIFSVANTSGGKVVRVCGGSYFGSDSNTATISSGISGLVLGGVPFISSWFNGKIYELCFVLKDASVADHIVCEGYLAHKWDALLGVTTLVGALPSDHPYKSTAP